MAGAGNQIPGNEGTQAPLLFKLSNGLTVILHRDPDLPLVTIEAAVKNGSFTEPPDMNGLSHLYEHMFFKGNAVFPDQESVLSRLRTLGTVFDATTSEEVVTYFLSLSSSRLDQGLRFLRDALLTPKFDPDELAKERRVVLAEYDRAEANPTWLLRRALDKALWYRYWSRKNPIGSRSVVAHATREQMRRIQRLYYQPTNTAIIVSGDISIARTKNLVTRLFGTWKGRPVHLPRIEHPALKTSKVLFVHRPLRMVTILVGLQGPALRDDRSATYAADVLTYALNQRAGAFQRRMVRSGLALRASAMYATKWAKGPIYFELTTTPQKALPATRALMELLPNLARPGLVSDADITTAKRLLAVQDTYDREAPVSYAHLLAHWWATSGLDYYLTYIRQLSRVSRQDIARFVDRYVAKRPMVIGILCSRQSASRAGLTKEAVEKLLVQSPGDMTKPRSPGNLPENRPGRTDGGKEPHSHRDSRTDKASRAGRSARGGVQ